MTPFNPVAAPITAALIAAAQSDALRRRDLKAVAGPAERHHRDVLSPSPRLLLGVARPEARAAQLAAGNGVAADVVAVAELVAEEAVDALHRGVAGRQQGRLVLAPGLPAANLEGGPQAMAADAQLDAPATVRARPLATGGGGDRALESNLATAALGLRRRDAQPWRDRAVAPAVDDPHARQATALDAPRDAQLQALRAGGGAHAVGADRRPAVGQRRGRHEASRAPRALPRGRVEQLRRARRRTRIVGRLAARAEAPELVADAFEEDDPRAVASVASTATRHALIRSPVALTISTAGRLLEPLGQTLLTMCCAVDSK